MPRLLLRQLRCFHQMQLLVHFAGLSKVPALVVTYLID
jgi:hypothetical protein